eukprot:6209063-Pleurochrysis_carterae.AAC.2
MGLPELTALGGSTIFKLVVTATHSLSLLSESGAVWKGHLARLCGLDGLCEGEQEVARLYANQHASRADSYCLAGAKRHGEGHLRLPRGCGASRDASPLY